MGAVSLWLTLIFAADLAWGRAPRHALRLVGPALLLAYCITVRLATQRMRKRARWNPSCQSTGDTQSARMICYGDVIELARVNALTGHMREPYIAMRILPLLDRRTAIFAAIAFLCTGLLGGCEFFTVGSEFLVAGPCLALLWIYPRLTPRYYRVSAGRIEVLDYRFLRSEGRVVASADLNHARVICRYDQRRLDIILPENCSSESMRIDLWALANPHEFAEAVFCGALCTQQAPALPETELLG